MKSRFSPQYSDEDLDLYLLGKATQNLTADIEEHYFGASATGYPRVGPRWEAIVITAAVASLLSLFSLRMSQKQHVETIVSEISSLPLFASAMAASIDLYAPVVLYVTTPMVQLLPPPEPKAQKQFQLPPQRPHSMVRIAMVDPPAVIFYPKALPELPFEPEIPQVSGPPKRNRLRRFLSGTVAPLKMILMLDRYNRGA